MILRKGETYLGSLLIVLILFLIFAALISQNVRVRSSPIVDEAFWLVEDQRVTAVHVGGEVEAHVIIRATGEYVGSVVVKIRKDIAFWFDKEYAILTAPISLRDDEKTEIELAFIPDKASMGNLRGYFIEVDFLVTKAEWVMENSYPPRLKVRPADLEGVLAI